MASEKFSPPRARPAGVAHKPPGQQGITVELFLKENDVSTKVQEAFDKLMPNRLYTVDDIIEMTGLRKGFPLLRQTLDAHREYHGKGVVDGQIYFGHPDKIAELKSLKAMS